MYRREMEYALEDGALPWDVDAALEAYGFAMGPFAQYSISPGSTSPGPGASG